MNPLTQKIKENEFESRLAVFVSFVEDEANRIDEERRGARRRDGGRKMMCASFLRKFENHLKTSILDTIERWCGEMIKKEKSVLPVDEIEKVDERAFCAGIASVQNFIREAKKEI